MKHLFTISLCFLALSLSAQETITYPYNPDGNADGSITVPDLQDFLGNYGGAFSPSDILVDGETLVTVLTNLQNSIDSLSALTGGSAGSVLDMPIGTILPVASEAVPEDWMLCDGREVEIEDYQAFYDLIGTTYGAGDSAFWAQVNYPATTFNIPDLRGRTIIGADNMGGESAGVVSQYPSWLGKSGGAEMHQLTEDEMASLNIFTGNPGNPYAYGPAIPNFNSPLQEDNSFSGGQGYPYIVGWSALNTNAGDQPHNNMQPYIALNYMVKVKAAFDVIGDLQSQIDSLSQVVSNLDSTLSVFTSFFNFGCTDSSACNYDISANINDGSCTGITGCADSTAFNYNSSVTCDDGSCIAWPSIGDSFQGGIVFWLDGNGGGLIAAPSDQTSSIWGCSGITITGANGLAIGTGNQNTIDIEAECPTPGIAADICANLTLGGYSDWFLPSQNELAEMCSALHSQGIGGFANNWYWSSTQLGINNAYGWDFTTCVWNNYVRTNNSVNLRAIRAF